MSTSAGRLVATEARRIRYRFLTGVAGVSAAGVVIVAVGTFVHHTSHAFGPGDLRRTVAFSVAPLAVAALVIGASTVGTDLSSRAFTTLLLYEPRRRRVLGARAGVCAAAMAALTTVVLAALTLTLVPSLTTHGGPGSGEVDIRWWASLVGLAGRASLLVAAAAVAGVALAALARGTLGAIAVTAGYAFLDEQPVAGFWPPLSQWLPIADAVSWVTGDGAHSTLASGAVLAGVVLALGTAADVAFRRQDIA
jgi:hypothetical protein